MANKDQRLCKEPKLLLSDEGESGRIGFTITSCMAGGSIYTDKSGGRPIVQTTPLRGNGP